MPNKKISTEELPSLSQLIMEATRSVEDELRLEDQGWVNLSTQTAELIPAQQRQANLKLSRLYYTKDPLGKQAIRLWTDYTFGPGIAWSMQDDAAEEILKSFWKSKANQSVFSARGQRRCSDKLLVDGEIFFVLFLGPNGQVIVRTIDPLQITEIITDPEDIESVFYYRRQWSTTQGSIREAIYCSISNIKGESCQDMYGVNVIATEDAIVYHLTQNTIGQRGNPLLLPALDWIRQYRRFLASRVAIMLALARFAWKRKIKGGQATVDAIKAKTHQQQIAAGSEILENLGVDTTPIKTDSGARNAYEDGRQIKLMVAAAVGIPEQYFGDISIGNLATAKTVELPMMKMFQSYQQVWKDSLLDIFEVVLQHNNIKEANWYVDIDFPPIAPEDVAMAAKSMVDIISVMPEFAYASEVQQMALMILGINDPAEVLEGLEKESRKNPDVALTKAIRIFKESLKKEQ